MCPEVIRSFVVALKRTNENHPTIHEISMSKFTTPFSGGCACGAIRYESTAEPVMMQHCHCRDCQRSSGGPFASYLIVPAESFQVVQGALRFHGTPSEAGGKTHRGFCPECGARVAVKPEAAPQFVAIHAASLDDPSGFKPGMDAWTSDAQPWDAMNPALAKFEKYPGA
jgi:hypothetical protein